MCSNSTISYKMYVVLQVTIAVCQHCVSKKSGNCAKCLMYALPAQAQEYPAGGERGCFSRFCLKSQHFFCKIELKFLNSRVLAGGFEMGRAKKSWFQAYIKNVVEKSAG